MRHWRRSANSGVSVSESRPYGAVTPATAWAAVAVLISAVTGVLTARALAPDSRGTLALVLSIAGVCVLAGALGTTAAIRAHLPRAKGVTARAYERLSAALLLPLVSLLLIALLVAAGLLDASFASPAVAVAFVSYGIASFLSGQAFDLLNARGQIVESARYNAIGSLGCLALVIVVTLSGATVATLVGCYAVAALLQFVLAMRRALRDRDAAEGSGGARILLRDGIRLLGLTLGQNLAYRADTVALGALSGEAQVGFYAVATTPAAVLRLPSIAVGQVAFHRAASGVSSAAGVVRPLLVLMAILVPLAVVGWVTADWLIPVLFGDAYRGAVQPFRILLLAELALAPFLVLGRAVAGLGGTWGASIPGVVGIGVLLVGAAILIPGLGAVGAAWASVAAYAVMSLAAALALVFRRA